MDSGLGGGFQMVIFIPKTNAGYYINARETSGANVPTHSGQTTEHIGVPSMLAGYQYIYNNLRNWGIEPTVTWHELFDKNIDLAIDGFPISKTLGHLLFNQLGHIPYLWEVSEDNKILKNPVLANYLIEIARHGPLEQPFYMNNTYINQVILAKELKALATFITPNDVINYRVIQKRALNATCFNYTVYTSRIPGSGFLQLFGCRLLEEAVSNHQFLTWPDEHQFLYKLHIYYYMYSLHPHLKKLTLNNLQTILSRDIPILSNKIITKLNQPLPRTIAQKIGNTSLPISYVLKSHIIEHGTSNICLANNESYLCATSTVNWGFGSGFYSNSFGFFYNNQLSDFTYHNLKNGNRPRPYAHPQSSIAPTIFVDSHTKQFEFGVGAAGGKKIISATFSVLYNNIMQKLKAKDYDCIESQLSARCLFRQIPTHKTVLMRLDCEDHLDLRFKTLLENMNINIRYKTEAGYSAATTIVKNKTGCHDPRRGGKGIYIKT